MQLCFFDDSAAQRLKPLTLTRPACDLRVGALTIQGKWEYELDSQTKFISTEEYLKPVYNPDLIDSKKDSFWINGRLLPDENLVTKLKNSKANTFFVFEEEIVAANLDGNNTSIAVHENLKASKLEKTEVVELSECTIINHLWDLFDLNKHQIEADLGRLQLKSIGIVTHTPVYSASTPEQIYIGEDVKIENGAILIADEGPIIIQDGAKITAGAIIRGPVSIGPYSTIKMGAKIYGNCSFGPHCKIGGEVSDSLFHSYSNKGHDGFVGHSLIGQWVNIGADTNTSNLKNNYSPVKIIDWSSKKNTATGQQFFGSVLADHTKTAINTMLNTGTVAGVSCNIVSDTFPPKFIPNFAWFSKGDIIKYNFGKATDAMRAMMKRRSIEPSEDYLNMMKHIHDQD